MKYFYDTEFVDDGHTIDLISIGIVADDGREYYAHLDSYDQRKAEAHPFVSKEVLPYLGDMPTKPRAQVAQEIAEFIKPDEQNELWGFFPAFDHCALAQLFGPMDDLPRHIPMRTNCVAQMADIVNAIALYIEKPDNDNAHDALADALWTKEYYYKLLSELGDYNG